MTDGAVIDYLNPDAPAGLRLLDVPPIRANRHTLKGYGEVVRDPKKQKVEIVPWPLNGSRKLDAGTGKMQVMFGECEIAVGEEPLDETGKKKKRRDGRSEQPPAPDLGAFGGGFVEVGLGEIEIARGDLHAGGEEGVGLFDEEEVRARVSPEPTSKA